MDIEFKNLSELRERVTPALNTKLKELYIINVIASITSWKIKPAEGIYSTYQIKFYRYELILSA